MEAIALLALTLNAAICAAVPSELKAKAPRLWGVLDALALNVGHATNQRQIGATWQQLLAGSVVAAICTMVGLHATPPEPVASAVPPAPAVVVDDAQMPCDPTACTEPVDATVAVDAAVDTSPAEVQ